MFFFIGNDKIHELTKTNQKLNIILTDADGVSSDGTWSYFSVADESENYKLSVSF